MCPYFRMESIPHNWENDEQFYRLFGTVSILEGQRRFTNEKVFSRATTKHITRKNTTLEWSRS